MQITNIHWLLAIKKRQQYNAAVEVFKLWLTVLGYWLLFLVVIGWAATVLAQLPLVHYHETNP
jgi:hypothetical protein